MTIDIIPNDLIIEICSFIQIKDLSIIMRISKKFHAIINNENQIVWQYKLEYDLCIKFTIVPVKKTDIDRDIASDTETTPTNVEMQINIFGTNRIPKNANFKAIVKQYSSFSVIKDNDSLRSNDPCNPNVIMTANLSKYPQYGGMDDDNVLADHIQAIFENRPNIENIRRFFWFTSYIILKKSLIEKFINLEIFICNNLIRFSENIQSDQLQSLKTVYVLEPTYYFLQEDKIDLLKRSIFQFLLISKNLETIYYEIKDENFLEEINLGEIFNEETMGLEITQVEKIITEKNIIIIINYQKENVPKSIKIIFIKYNDIKKIDFFFQKALEMREEARFD